MQIDNWDELGMIEEITAIPDHPVNVGIRIWMDTGLTPAWSKFGFSFASGEAARAALRSCRESTSDTPHAALAHRTSSS